MTPFDTDFLSARSPTNPARFAPRSSRRPRIMRRRRTSVPSSSTASSPSTDRQRGRRDGLLGVLRQSAASHHRATELTLDHPKRMLCLRANARFQPLNLVTPRCFGSPSACPSPSRRASSSLSTRDVCAHPDIPRRQRWLRFRRAAAPRPASGHAVLVEVSITACSDCCLKRYSCRF